MLEITLFWDEGWLPPPNRRDEFEALVRADDTVIECARARSNLILHYIRIEGSEALIFVYGDGEKFGCQWVAPPWRVVTPLTFP